jgi:hypothetical protein
MRMPGSRGKGYRGSFWEKPTVVAIVAPAENPPTTTLERSRPYLWLLRARWFSAFVRSSVATATPCRIR